MKIILGSGSKWRKIILEKAGYDFEVMTADIDEKAIRRSLQQGGERVQCTWRVSARRAVHPGGRSAEAVR